MKRVRVALLGLGRWGSNYLRILSEHPRFEIACAFDPDPEARARAKALVAGLTLAESAEQALASGAAAAILATPNRTHAELSLRALSLGLDVLVEKPLSTSVPDARAVAEASRGRTLLVGHVVLHLPVVRALLGALDDLPPPASTRHVRISAGARHNDADPVWALGPHDVAVMLKIMRALPERVRACVTERGVEAVARFRSGAESRFAWSRTGAEPCRTLHVAGPGYAFAADEARSLLRSNLEGAEAEQAPPAERALENQCAHFAACLAGDEPIETVAEAAANVQILASMAESVGRRGAWVRVALPEAPAPHLPPADPEHERGTRPSI